MLKRIEKKKNKKTNTALISKYSDMLDDLLTEGKTIKESLHILHSKISKSKDKINVENIIRRLSFVHREKIIDYEIDHFLKIFSNQK